MSRYRGVIILVIDVLLIFCCNFLMFLSHLLRDDIQLLNLVLHIGFMTACILVFQIWMRTYDTLWRYAESGEYLTLLKGVGLGFAFYALVNFALDTAPIWVIQGFTGTTVALLIMLLYRFIYRSYRRRVVGIGVSTSWAAIVGGGDAGAALISELIDHIYVKYKPYCVIDDAVEKQSKRIHGVRVLGPIEKIGEILENTPVTDIILTIQNLSPQRRKEILELCAATQLKVHILGDPVSTISGDTVSRYTSNVREVEIEDLIGRAPVKLNNPRSAEFICGKTVLVTGGGGSIGSELCRQIAAYSPKRLIILDIAENTTYDLQNDLLYKYGADFPLSVEIASVRDVARLNRIFEEYHPQLVFHAAAHKHVPLMESCPDEAVKNNVFGTYNTALAAKRYGVEKFVLISTDKAVNPTNVMGATKNLCEQVIQGLREDDGTKFAAVRFGNVLESSGSVVPLFKKQIDYGGPVTVTDKRIIRYFMTIPEAAQLVLEAGSFAMNGEVFVLDMGEPVSILELAEKLIRLSGHVPYKEIDIKEIGLRPGEKLYEELLMSNDRLRRTENEKIFVETRPSIEMDRLCSIMDQLASAVEDGSSEQILTLMHEFVPGFRTPDEVNNEAIKRRQVE